MPENANIDPADEKLRVGQETFRRRDSLVFVRAMNLKLISQFGPGTGASRKLTLRGTASILYDADIVLTKAPVKRAEYLDLFVEEASETQKSVQGQSPWEVALWFSREYNDWGKFTPEQWYLVMAAPTPVLEQLYMDWPRGIGEVEVLLRIAAWERDVSPYETIGLPLTVYLGPDEKAVGSLNYIRWDT